MTPQRPGAWGRTLAAQAKSARRPEATDLGQRDAVAKVYETEGANLARALIEEIVAGVAEAGAELSAPDFVDITLQTEGREKRPWGVTIARPGSRDAFRLTFGRSADAVAEVRLEVAGRVEVRHVPCDLDGDVLTMRVGGAAVTPAEAGQRLVAPFLRLAVSRHWGMA